MATTDETLDLLRFELKFLEDGGYGRSPHSPWRTPRMFEDSPSCLNFDDPARPHPCNECLLMQFVPEDLRTHERPCRVIPLDAHGRTVSHFDHHGTQAEMEEVLMGWVRNRIKELEAAKVTADPAL